MKQKETFGWEGTIIKSKDFKWEQPAIKNTADGKLDFNIHIPLTALFERQARRSYARGMFDMMLFQIQMQKSKKIIDAKDLQNLFTKVGLPEIAEKFKDAPEMQP
jgi:hypothetical protein